ncbi:hypothetical protein [Rhizobium rosettiformans]|uniref:hypothetical protein n=1 Tax=Rhizobium rosettiformans TaxID=1368430 RepID=UPI002865DC0F|nr:hypothetical protein [Rhizobium rosettiformans]MDR7028939.1 hypothetical protein [Rhizobium rosettiformans]MDR7063779.1 hypothetical protein [Rhizobium rosettiformans]
MSVNVSRGVVAVSLMMVLSGCNAGGLGSGLGLSSSQPAAATPAATPGQAAFVQGFCPQIALRDGTSFYRSYVRGKDGDAEQVIFQASLADTTRSCARTETTLTINALVQGRLVAGPQGKAGTINLPVRVTVMDGDQEVFNEVEQYPVTLADVNLPTQFIYSKAVNVPGNVSGTTRVTIGFEQPKKK